MPVPPDQAPGVGLPPPDAASPDDPGVLPSRTRTRLSPLGLAAAAAGLGLFAWALHRTGLGTIADGIGRVGAGFLAILALAGLRFWVRAVAWALATEGSVPLRVRDTFPALVAGDTLGNLTPLGLVLSETVKVAFVRRRISMMAALAGITVENLAYTLSVAVVIGAGTIALLSLFDVGDVLRHVTALGLTAIVGLVLLVAVVLWRQIKVASGTLAWLERRGRGPGGLTTRLAKLRTLEDLVYGFAGRHPGRTAAVLLLECAFHLLGILEIWITLALLLGGAAPTLLTTFVLESVNRTIMVVFKFVPLRLGVDEVGTELLTRTLGLPAGIGVTMAVVRKARMISWSAVGVGFLVRRGVGRQ
jgi:hypothetical protein